MALHWLQKTPESLAWNMSPSIIWLVSSLPVSGFSLTNQGSSRSKQFLIPWVTQLLFLLSMPLSPHSLCLGSPPLQVHSVASTHWLTFYGSFSTSLLQEKWPIAPMGAASTLTYRPYIGLGPWLLPKLHAQSLLPSFIPHTMESLQFLKTSILLCQE